MADDAEVPSGPPQWPRSDCITVYTIRITHREGYSVIPEIGIMLATFIISQVVPEQWRSSKRTTSIVAALIALLVAIDLGVRGFGNTSLWNLASDSDAASIQGAERAASQAERTVKSTAMVTTADGGSITTDLRFGIAVAKDSSLHREWIAVHDSAFPVDLKGTPGVTTIYEHEKYGGKYFYHAKFIVTAREPLRALEVRFLTFDVWGKHVRTLRFNLVEDIKENWDTSLEGKWRLHDENDVEAHYASIAYVAKARLADGQVVVAHEEPVLAEARKFFDRFSPADLEPHDERQDQEGT